MSASSRTFPGPNKMKQYQIDERGLMNRFGYPLGEVGPCRRRFS